MLDKFAQSCTECLRQDVINQNMIGAVINRAQAYLCTILENTALVITKNERYMVMENKDRFGFVSNGKFETEAFFEI